MPFGSSRGTGSRLLGEAFELVAEDGGELVVLLRECLGEALAELGLLRHGQLGHERFAHAPEHLGFGGLVEHLRGALGVEVALERVEPFLDGVHRGLGLVVAERLGGDGAGAHHHDVRAELLEG